MRVIRWCGVDARRHIRSEERAIARDVVRVRLLSFPIYCVSRQSSMLMFALARRFEPHAAVLCRFHAAARGTVANHSVPVHADLTPERSPTNCGTTILF